MIYPNISLESWLEKYPDLKVQKLVCTNCGETMISTIPFLSKGYAGIESPPCVCGQNTHKCSSAITITKESFEKWNNILKPWLGE